ncbi:uncharacterized protein LOC120842863, partial [Ixodes scapularis]|uniref:uncharacterized protein LOC120842863 n=1 Tax=Ixodes scapularis TaxID=6945 RepID=UPI001C38C52F
LQFLCFFRTLLKGCTTGSEGISWIYFYELHRFLGALPINDSSLVEECIDFSDVAEENIIEVTTKEDAVAADPDEDNQNQDLDLPGTSAKLMSVGAKNKTGSRNAGPQQPAKRKKVAEKQLEFMKGLLDEQRALRLCWENSRSSELALRERQLNLLENMQQDFASMRRRMEK